MASIRETILTAAVSQLQGAGKPSGLTVERFRTYQVEQGSLPFMVVRPVQEEVRLATQNRLSPLVERDLRLAVECWAQAGTGLSVDQALDPVLTWAVKALVGTGGGTLGGLAISVTEDAVEWDGDQSQGYGRGIATFTVRFRTTTQNPEA